MVDFPNPLPAKLIFAKQTMDVKILSDDLAANGDRVMTIRYTPDIAVPNPKSHSKYIFTSQYYQGIQDRMKYKL